MMEGLAIIYFIGKGNPYTDGQLKRYMQTFQ